MKKLFSLFMAFVEMSLFAALALAASVWITGEVVQEYALIGVGVAFLFSLVKKENALFETVPIENVRAAITNSMIEVYRERPIVKDFLSSLFPSKTATTKFISIEVQRGTETLAVDVIRGTGSNYNQVTKSTMKTILPAYYDEEFSANQLEIYDVAIGSLTQSTMRQLASEMAYESSLIIDKIKRSYQKQKADALQTGIIQFSANDNIDFRRKAASKVDDSAQYFSDTSVDPGLAFARAGKFLREEGKIQVGPGSRYLCILGSKAFQDLLGNPIFQAKYDRKHIHPGDIVPAEMSTVGASYHGYISVGDYVFDLWTYPEVYELVPNGTKYSYIETTNMIVTTYKPNFSFVYGMVPQLQGFVTPMTMEEGFYSLEYLDPKKMNHGVSIKSAGVAVLTGVDQVYTQKATAS
jgi:hypothetical protein